MPDPADKTETGCALLMQWVVIILLIWGAGSRMNRLGERVSLLESEVQALKIKTVTEQR